MKLSKLIELSGTRIQACLNGDMSIREIITQLSAYRYAAKHMSINLDRLDKYTQNGLRDSNHMFSFKFTNMKEKEVTECIFKAISARFSQNEYQTLVQQAKGMVESYADELSIMWLLDAETFAMSGGLFVLSYNIRQLCIGKLIKKYEHREKVHYFDVQRLYASYLSVNEPENAMKVLGRASKLWIRHHDEIRQLMSVFARQGKLGEILPPKEFNNKAEKAFHKLVHGKRVAIIGPANERLDVDEITREFDLVIVLNYRGNEFLCEDVRRCGVDISYYNELYRLNHVSSESFSLETEAQYFRDIKMAVFKSLDSDFQINMFRENRCRKLPGLERIFLYQGFCNLMQNVLVDLFSFAPARIKVFRTNLFLAEAGKRYQKEYVAGEIELQLKEKESALNAIRLQNYAMHNLISNYEITKYWYDVGYFEADEGLAKILSLGTSEYCHRMELLEF